MLPGDSIGVGSEWIDEWGVWQVAGAENMSGVWIWWRLKCSLSFTLSLCSRIVPQKHRGRKRSLKIGGQPLSQPASTRVRSLDKIKQHLCWRQRRGGHIPLGTANAEWEMLAAFHSTHQHTVPIPPGMLPGSYRQRGLSNPAFPQSFPFAEPDRKRRLNDTLTVCRLPWWLHKPGWLH